jgi:hypothetical protein
MNYNYLPFLYLDLENYLQGPSTSIEDSENPEGPGSITVTLTGSRRIIKFHLYQILIEIEKNAFFEYESIIQPELGWCNNWFIE